MTFGVIAFIVAILASVMLHEAGHFAMAKAFGMKATQFFVGFGPTLWSVRRGETEYGVKAIPAGGFVKIVGMTELEEVPAADQPRAFYRQPAPQRAVVLAAGSTMHFVIAFVLIWFVLSGLGLPALTTTVGSVSPCITQDDAARCTSADPASPAALAGIRPGDRIVAIDGRPVTEWSNDVATMVRAHGAGPLTVVVERGGSRLTLDPILTDRSLLGIRPAERLERLAPWTGLGRTVVGMGQAVGATFAALGSIPAGIPKLFDSAVNHSRRDATGLVGAVGAARASGQALAGTGSLAERLGTFLILIAGLNMFIGVFNLLPLLPLDGGHLAVLGYEKVRQGIARLRGRPDPGRPDITKLLPAAYLVIAVFIGLSVLLLYADVVNPIPNQFG
jgi:membrane-associated protease RseP (regulator of RpoE activity)